MVSIPQPLLLKLAMSGDERKSLKFNNTILRLHRYTMFKTMESGFCCGISVDKPDSAPSDLVLGTQKQFQVGSAAGGFRLATLCAFQCLLQRHNVVLCFL